MKPLDELTQKELKVMEGNVRRWLESGDSGKETAAAERMALLEAEKSRREQARKRATGSLVWNRSNRLNRVATMNGQPVAAIRKNETHNSRNGEIYSLHIGDETLPRRHRLVRDAEADIESELVRRAAAVSPLVN